MLSIVLIVAAIVLIIAALSRDGNNTWLALAGPFCAVGATFFAVGPSMLRTKGRRKSARKTMSP